MAGEEAKVDRPAGQSTSIRQFRSRSRGQQWSGNRKQYTVGNTPMRKKTEAGTPMERMLRLVTSRGVRDERVLSAMRATPRERFFPKDLRDGAYADDPAPIGHGQTISQP